MAAILRPGQGLRNERHHASRTLPQGSAVSSLRWSPAGRSPPRSGPGPSALGTAVGLGHLVRRACATIADRTLQPHDVGAP